MCEISVLNTTYGYSVIKCLCCGTQPKHPRYVPFKNNVSKLYASKVQLRWDANTEPNLAGYYIHYGLLSVCGSANEGNNFTDIIDVGNETDYIVRNLKKGTYNFAVTAYDSNGNESQFSYIIIILHSRSVLLYHLHRLENVKLPYQSIYQYLVLQLG